MSKHCQRFCAGRTLSLQAKWQALQDRWNGYEMVPSHSVLRTSQRQLRAVSPVLKLTTWTLSSFIGQTGARAFFGSPNGVGAWSSLQTFALSCLVLAWEKPVLVHPSSCAYSSLHGAIVSVPFAGSQGSLEALQVCANVWRDLLQAKPGLHCCPLGGTDGSSRQGSGCWQSEGHGAQQ